MDRSKMLGLGLGLALAASGTLGAAVGWSSHSRPVGELSQPVLVAGGYSEYFYNFARKGSNYMYVDAFRSLGGYAGAKVTSDRVTGDQDVSTDRNWHVFLYMRFCANGCQTIYAWPGRSGFVYDVEYSPVLHTYKVSGSYQGVPFSVMLEAEGYQSLTGWEQHHIAPGDRGTPVRGFVYTSQGMRRGTAFRSAYYGHHYMDGSNYDYGQHSRQAVAAANAGYTYYGGCGGYLDEPLLVSPKGC